MTSTANVSHCDGDARPEWPGRDEYVGDFAGVVRLLDKASEHLRSPAIVLGVAKQLDKNVLDYEIRICIAGEGTRDPGSLDVVRLSDDRTPEPVRYGRIYNDGVFKPSRTDPPPEEVKALLRRFAAEPAKMAQAHCRLTGRCCFCNKPLRDERSTSVGYGPDCAKNFDMPW